MRRSLKSDKTVGDARPDAESCTRRSEKGRPMIAMTTN